MNPPTSTSVLFLDAVPGVLLVGLTLLLLAAWVFSHLRWKAVRPGAFSRYGQPAIRWLMGSVGIWLLLHSLSRVLLLATPWPWLPMAMLAAAGIEGMIWMYQLEGQAAPPSIRKKILGLRLATLVLVILILTEPVVERFIQRTHDRFVVILLDQSESMQLRDPQRNAEEMIDLASFHGILNAEDYEGLGADKKPRLPDSVEALLQTLDPAKKEAVMRLQEETREQTAEGILRGREGHPGLIEQLKKSYGVKLVGFAASPKAYASPDETETEETKKSKSGLADWKRLTHLSSALEYTLDNIPTEQLAGVVLLSDFRDTARGIPEAAARKLGQNSAVLVPVLLGSSISRQDLAVTHVDAPESIYKGEKLSVEADLKLYGVAGRQIKVFFKRGPTLIKEEILSVPAGEEHYRTLVKFSDDPEEDGILSYSIQIEEIENEVVLENNLWHFQTAVSEDRTNVLLVDRRPRWEFRYLRNLFYGRDKSVHLQYVLTEPDVLPPSAPGGAVPRPPIVASASRPFGEAEATMLPVTREEWRKFDVIILGDVSPEVLTDSQISHIEHCVNERGTALVIIAGPAYMPHKFDHPTLRNLLPVVFNPSLGSHFDPPEIEYQLQLSLEGRRHPIMQLVSGTSVNESLWNNLPNLQWRYDAENVKPGATVLAYATTVTAESSDMLTADASPEKTAQRIKELTEIQQHNSLIVTQSYGLGKVLMLNFDRTWRLRFRIGDTLHHRFWGQIMTWGAGENLRAGSEFLRLGTDGITYSPGESVTVSARVLRPDYMPVINETITVEVTRDHLRIGRHNLRYRPQSQGMYDAEIGPYLEPGNYRISLVGPAVDRILESSNIPRVETEFQVATASNPVEWAEFSSDRETAQRIAEAGKGKLFTPGTMGKTLPDFGPGTQSEPERADITLWDHWGLLILLIILLTSEWLLRRKGGLV